MGFAQRRLTRLIGDTTTRTNNTNIQAQMGVPDTSVATIYDDLGDFTARVNQTSLLSAIGLPDVAGKDLYTVLIPDRLSHPIFGLSALKTEHDATQALIGTPVGVSLAADIAVIDSTLGTPALASMSADIANVLSAIQAVQNNTRFTAQVPTKFVLPSAGSIGIEIFSNLYDTAGNMENPDGDMAIEIKNSAGTDRSGNLYDDAALTIGATGTVEGGLSGKEMISLSTGRFHTYYKLTFSDAEETLNFHFSWNENAVTIHQDRSTVVVSFDADLSTVLSRLGAGLDAQDAATKLDNIKAATDAVQADVGNPSARANLTSLEAMLGNPDAAGSSIYDNLGDFVGMTNFSSLKDVIGLPDVAGKSLYTVLVTDRLDSGAFGLSAIKSAVDAISATIGTSVDAADIDGSIYAALQSIYDSVVAVASSTGARSSNYVHFIAPGGAGSELDSTDPTEFETSTTAATTTSFAEMYSIEIDTTETDTKTVNSVLLDLSWNGIVSGPGAKTGLSKWTVDGGSGAAFGSSVDITTDFSESSVKTEHNASGAIKLADMATLPFTIYLAGKIDDVGDTLTCKVLSTSEVHIYYVLS